MSLAGFHAGHKRMPQCDVILYCMYVAVYVITLTARRGWGWGVRGVGGQDGTRVSH